jgi:hypothetical protein
MVSAEGDRLPVLRALMGMMGRVLLLVALIGGFLVLGCFAFLAFWDIPAPIAKVERVLPDARFPK